jgi:hypothetical protein
MISLCGHLCELQIHYKGLIKKVSFAIAMQTQTGEVYHGQTIPAGYASVGVEEVCEGYFWWSLNTKSYRQLCSGIKENYTTYSHICITNLAAQMYLHIWPFQNSSPK